jgi:prepilin-type processing-associated H-X9-DG protein
MNRHLRRAGPTARPRTAFTLVELLVVIGIIALLIGILLPSLAKARKVAQRVRCASALHQLGIGFTLYANDSRDYLPPWRAGNTAESATQDGGRYDLNGIIYGDPTLPWVVNQHVNEAAYWMDFLAKYITPGGGRGGSGDMSGNQLGESLHNTVVWGCPNWDGYLETNTQLPSYGTPNRQRPGYAYNYMPKFEPGYPTPSMASYPNTPEKCDIRSSDNFTSQTWTSSDANTKAVWYKRTSITHQDQRALSGDCNDYAIEARAWTGTGTFPQLKTHYDSVMYARADGANGAIVPATTFDYYRHGTLPPVQNGGVHGFYNSYGGTVNFNILYFDGHVANVGDRREAYHSIRMVSGDPTTK